MTIFRVLGLAGALAGSVGAAHISAIKGKVSVRHGSAGAPDPGVLFAPLVTGDQVVTGRNSRADIQFDPGATFRVGGNSEVRLTQSGSGDYQLELQAGAVSYDPPGPSPVAVDTPIVTVRLLSQGSYRIGAGRAGFSEVTVREGEAEVLAASGSQSLETGQKMIVRGSRSDPEFKIVSAVSFWRRAAFLMRDAVQIGVAVSSAVSDDGDAPKTSAAAPKSEAPKTSPPPQNSPKSSPVIHAPPVRPGGSNKPADND